MQSYGSAKRSRGTIERSSAAVARYNGGMRKHTKRPKKVKRLFRVAAASEGPNMLMIPRNPSCFPEVLYTDLFFTERFNITITSGIGTNYIYRGNSLFDPNFSGVGMQPKWFDEIKAVYGQYEVLNTVAEANIIKQSSGAEVLEVAMAPFSPLSPPANFDEIENAENGSTAIITQASPNARLVTYGDSAKMTGRARGDDTISAVVTTNPGLVWYIYVSAIAPQGGTSELHGLIRIKYHAKFSMMTDSTS